ncbi:S9 family peptidase [Psychroserpens sp.]|uniref:S9 family peptidase n=1 Tax=Psychroserpens sp. TaxID=2020870 RepID=UPI001B149BA7|nr:S9 family peptidase [Psychroserpens sp.]MBO6606578.1 S9 family peptidase [Psychroserpens sp.]MBO6632094.1 S9 family peptidase [Psychroserpens sp.]MBO6653282.1 S9 family peptidase [Psychroserpens sp.]MBO6680691.1 S9 family peptidase [Psychroserpens sp.]MBO6750351.1 S9 family peptidase [Psychroserpens sp.]
MKTTADAPKAEKIPKSLTMHNDLRVDDYFWLNQRDDEAVLKYLKAENEYYHQETSHIKAFENELFEEMKARIKEDDSSVPYKYNGYWYIVRYEKGKNYPIYTRRKDTLEAEEELLFDCNQMAEGHSYFKLVGLSVSPDNAMIAFGMDTTGRRQYQLRIKNLKSGELLSDQMDHTTGSSAWANDNKTIYYTKKDEHTLRAHQVYRHEIGKPSNLDDLIYTEEDDTFGVAAYKSKSKKFIIIASYSTLTNEYRILNADRPDEAFHLFQERIRGLEYSIAHYKDHFYILTNYQNATNFKLMKTHEQTTEVANWLDVIPHRDEVLIEDIEIFKDYLVLNERSNGLNQIRIKRWDGSKDYYLPFNSETYTANLSTNVDFDTEILRYSYNSLTTPSSVIDFNMRLQTKDIKKEQEILDPSFDKSNYRSERLWATAEDGTRIPMSVVRHKDTKLDGNAPLLQYAYGSYGSTIDPYFSSIRLSLLNRGFIYVITHVRGSEYLGRQWYESGKLLQKKNTFSDFIDCSKHLIAINYTSPSHLYAMGGSAGGLLMGVILNEAPHLYNGVVAAVPFVDVVTTMLDNSIPLTTGEYDEWGNPNEQSYYNYMKSYSPYDNVKKQNYPHLLVTAGLHDSQVQYWEPAKWVAKLRTYKQDTNKLYLLTNMDAGHGGASGRFDAIKEDASEFAFLLDLEGIST